MTKYYATITSPDNKVEKVTIEADRIMTAENRLVLEHLEKFPNGTIAVVKRGDELTRIEKIQNKKHWHLSGYAFSG